MTPADDQARRVERPEGAGPNAELCRNSKSFRPNRAADSQAGIDQVNVSYRSGAEMLTSLLRNDSDTAIITVSTALGQIKEGKIRALAGAAMRLMPQLPDTPPAGQTIPDFDVTVWHGIVGPAGMDPGLVTRINGIFNQVLQVPTVSTAITGAQAAEIVGGTPLQFDAFIKSELNVGRRSSGPPE